MNIVFMGTPEFAVASLEILVENNYHVAAVVTAPDKPSGRGLQMNPSAVKTSALKHGIPVLQPLKLKDPEFLKELASYKPDLAIVVAFRMLPEMVWKMPRKGTFNLHASLLPQYRGAAPINRAIMNGETKSGISTFFLEEAIDTGKILFREEMEIGHEDTAGILHDKMMRQGAKLVLKTVQAIEKVDYTEIPQSTFVGKEILKEAAKIFKDDCKISWEKPLNIVYNQIRGLSPYPAAFTYLKGKDAKNTVFKIYHAKDEKSEHVLKPGSILSDYKTYLKVAVQGGFIHLLEVQNEGKKKMAIADFLRGLQNQELEIADDYIVR